MYWHNHGDFFLLLLRINGLQNTSEPRIGPWFSIPNEVGEGDIKMSVSEKSRS